MSTIFLFLSIFFYSKIKRGVGQKNGHMVEIVGKNINILAKMHCGIYCSWHWTRNMVDRRICQLRLEDQVMAESSSPVIAGLGEKPSNQMEKGPFNGKVILRITIKNR